MLPKPEDTKKAYTPVFTHLAKQLGADFDLVATTDWAGMAVAMGSGSSTSRGWAVGLRHRQQRDRLPGGRHGEVRREADLLAIIIARPDLVVKKFPDDTKGRSISFADVGSTSGWLIPSYYAKEVWKIDPKTFWKYTEGATHAANEIAVSSGQVDMATDFDRNRNAMIAAAGSRRTPTRSCGSRRRCRTMPSRCPRVRPRSSWRRCRRCSRRSPWSRQKHCCLLTTPGFVAATHACYESIEKAGIAVGKIKPRPA